MTISFLWIGFAGTDIGSERYLDARIYSIQTGNLPAHGSLQDTAYIATLLTSASMLGHLLHAIAIIGGLYVTFFYSWGRKA